MASVTPKAHKDTVAVRARFPKPLTKKQREKLYRPYALAIGDLLLAWNNLHEEIGHLFGRILNLRNSLVPMGAWYAIKNDALQRDMLEGVCKCAPHYMLGASSGKQGDDRRADVLWLLAEIGRLRNTRDDAIHAPFAFASNPEWSWLAPSAWRGNKRAQNLEKKNILQGFTLCYERTEALKGFAYAMHRSLEWPDTHAWPDRPELPAPREIQTPYLYRRRKALSHQRQPSPG